MKLKFFFLSLFCVIQFVSAQNSSTSINSGSIYGKVVDKKTKEAIPYVNIIVKEANTVISGGITQDNGNFNVKNLEFKNYTVEFQFIGYKKQTITISLTSTNKKINLGTLFLEDETVQLEGVDITNERSTIEQKIDRKIINVGKDLISAGATAGEIMNNIPSVSVDPQNNTISLRGNSNVRIFVDGKPTNIDPSQLLQQIPSASIKQIELITNPSAKYNPEGMSGIINIVLYKNSRLGFNGSLNNGVTFGKTPKLNSSLDLNYRVGKFNFYGNYGFNTGKYANNGEVTSREPSKENHQKFIFGDDNTSHLIKTGLDFYINEKNTLSFYTIQNLFKAYAEGTTDVNFVDDLTNPDIFQIFSNTNKTNSETYNLDYKVNFKKEGHSLEIEASYNKNDNPENALFEFPLNQTSYSNQVNTLGENTIVNIDYINPLSETTKLELGLEARDEKTDNSFDVDYLYNSDFNYRRTIYSGYATYGKQWNKWSMQAGTRIEQYDVDALFRKANEKDAPFTDAIFTLYPSAFLTYAPTDKNSFNLNYSRRVDRPSIQQINPIREWSTPVIDSKGNPDLVPQFTNSIELNYTRKTKIGSITSGVFYRIIQDEIARVVYGNPVDSNKQVLSYDNFDNNNAYGIEVSGNLDFTKWWSANIGLDAYGKTVKGTVETTRGTLEYVEIDALIFNARMNNTFKATKNLRFQLFEMYRGRDRSLQFDRKPTWKIDMGSSYTILKGKGTISARFSDIFRSMNFAFDADKPFERFGQFNWESRTAYVGFNYKFGSGKNSALKRKERDKNEAEGGGPM